MPIEVPFYASVDNGGRKGGVCGFLEKCETTTTLRSVASGVAHDLLTSSCLHALLYFRALLKQSALPTHSSPAEHRQGVFCVCVCVSMPRCRT